MADLQTRSRLRHRRGQSVCLLPLKPVAFVLCIFLRTYRLNYLPQRNHIDAGCFAGQEQGFIQTDCDAQYL
jgi:hypothetical protein